MSNPVMRKGIANHLIETFERDSNVTHGFRVPDTDRLTIGIVAKRGTLDRVRAAIEATTKITNTLTGMKAPFDIQYFEEGDES